MKCVVAIQGNALEMIYVLHKNITVYQLNFEETNRGNYN